MLKDSTCLLIAFGIMTSVAHAQFYELTAQQTCKIHRSAIACKAIAILIGRSATGDFEKVYSYVVKSGA